MWRERKRERESRGESERATERARARETIEGSVPLAAAEEIKFNRP
jgi:hypothetical protein